MKTYITEEAEREAFYAECWQRDEAPSDEAWRNYLYRHAFGALRQARRLLEYATGQEESIETSEAAADEIVALVNRYLRLPPCPAIPDALWEALDFDDYELDAALRSRAEQLQKIPYREYLLSPEWATIRAGALRRASHRCQACTRSRALHVHHRRYPERGREKPDDLIVLCEGCHLAVHIHGGSHKPTELR
jgi:hypothetical protein